MDQTYDMVEVLEDFIIHRVSEMKSNEKLTSPEEITALAELVKAVNQSPRTIKLLEPMESTFGQGTKIKRCSVPKEFDLDEC